MESATAETATEIRPRIAGYVPSPLRLHPVARRWWWLASALALADAITTYIALSHHLAREANPIFSQLVERLGLFPMVLTRTTLLGAGVMGVVAILASCERTLLRRGALLLLKGGALLWSAIVLNNLVVLAR